MQNSKKIEQKGRLEYLDIAKGISVILVALGHIYKNRSNVVRIWLYSFHIPIFFLISGYLSNYCDYDKYTIKELIKKKSRTLLIPYISFSLINAIIYTAFSVIKGEGIIYVTKDMLIRIVTFRGLCATWFLPCLFGCEVLFFVLHKKITNKYISNLVILCLFVFSLMGFFEEENIMCIPMRIFTSLGFYTLGYYAYNIKYKLKHENIMIILLFALNIFMTIFNGHVELYLLIYNNPIVYVINSIIGSLFIILLCKKIKHKKLLNYYGNNSIIIMVTHFILASVIIEVYGKFVGSINEYLDGIIILCIVMLIEIILIEIVNKYFYRLIGKKK